jgi:hypothetical protein
MPAHSDEVSQIVRVLSEVFPGADAHQRPLQRNRGGSAIQMEIGPPNARVRLLVSLVGASSRARLIDAAELARVDAGHGDDAIPVLASPYFSPASQQLLRDMRVSFIDLAGNAWVVASGIHVDRRGFGNPQREQRDHRDLFSDKASLVLRILARARSPLGVRQIADIAGSGEDGIPLSPGYVSKIVSELERRGYAGRRVDGIVLQRADDLLSEWVVAYRQHRSGPARSYFLAVADPESAMPRIARALDQAGVDYVFSGHAGASLVDRHAVFDAIDLYVREPDRAREVLESEGARAVDRGGNINILRPYYRASAFWDRQVLRDSMRAASDLQLYLDLYDYPVRGREQAEHLYERRLRSWFERGDQL